MRLLLKRGENQKSVKLTKFFILSKDRELNFFYSDSFYMRDKESKFVSLPIQEGVKNAIPLLRKTGRRLRFSKRL